MMGIGFLEGTILFVPIAAVVFVKSKNLLKKKFQTDFTTRILFWSILLTVVITPLIFMALIALIFFSFSFYESLDY
jgi:hypothetical protein